ncbi:MAG: TNT domain-containing protein [Pseudonocardiaceae bacterium]
MAHPTQLNATEQDTLVKQIGLALLRSAPRDWQRITTEYRAVGRYHELDGEVTLTDGATHEWVATHDIATLFGRLRAGMYRDERGTWFNASYQLDAPSSYNLEYDRDEPRWHLMPPPQAYADELRLFPRSEENVPEWLMRRMAGLAPERPGPRFRIARVFDGTGPSGRPLINRPELEVEDQDELLEYLTSAPVVLPGRGFDIDRLATTPEPSVPVAFHSDGRWIWPAAVNYYLDQYGVSPEPDLVEHIRKNSFTVPEVSEDQRTAANAYLTRGNAPPPQAAPAGPPPMPRSFRAAPIPPAQPAVSAEAPTAGTAEDTGRHAAGGDPIVDDTQMALPSTMFAPLPDLEDDNVDQPVVVDETSAQVQAAGDSHAAGAADEPAIKHLRSKLEELGVDDVGYSIGEPTEHGWSLEQVPEGWRVGWYDESLTNPAVFGDAEDAAAFMVGKLLLASRGKAHAERQENGTHERDEPRSSVADALAPAPGAGHRPEPGSAMGSAEVPARTPTDQPPTVFHQSPVAAPPPVAPAAGAPSQPPSGQQWPIQPLAGEPPLTLFRGKELQELPAGSELDRFGMTEGNLTYAAGTPFSERSLVPEWVNRPYHVYRVQRPIEALAGSAISWFNQPGGGAAYLLPASIEELVADGVLIELDPGEPPID